MAPRRRAELLHIRNNAGYGAVVTVLSQLGYRVQCDDNVTTDWRPTCSAMGYPFWR